MKNKIPYYILILLLFASCFSGFKKHDISPGIVLIGEQEKQIQSVFKNQNYYSITNDLLIKIDTLQRELSDSLSNQSAVDTNNNILKLYFRSGNDTVKTQIEVSGSLEGLNDNFQCDYYKNYIFILWVSELFKPYRFSDSNPKHSYDLHLKVIDVNTYQAVFEEVLYKTNCCINRLSMMFNPFNQSVLVAYNDFSKSDNSYLMFGWISLNYILKQKIVFHPMESLLQDRSEKRAPKFVKNNKDVFMYNSSGDRYGMMAYEGKQDIGISRIDNQNKLSEYRIISDSLPVNEFIHIIGDTVFYSVHDSHDQLKITYKKIHINNLALY